MDWASFCYPNTVITTRHGICEGVAPIVDPLILALLGRNTRNRKLSAPQLEIMRKEFEESGGYKYNGVPVVLSTEDIILDGGHRLNCLLGANVDDDIKIMWNVPSDRWSTYDGWGRKLNQLIDIDSRYKPQYKNLGAAVVWLLAMERGNVRLQRSGPKAMRLSMSAMENHYNRVRDELVGSQEFIRKFIAKSRNDINTINFGPLNMWIAIHVMMKRVDDKKADSFFNLMRSPEIAENHPSKMCANTINSLKRGCGTSRETKDNYIVAHGIVMKAFTLYNMGADSLAELTYEVDV